MSTGRRAQRCGWRFGQTQIGAFVQGGFLLDRFIRAGRGLRSFLVDNREDGMYHGFTMWKPCRSSGDSGRSPEKRARWSKVAANGEDYVYKR
jgi:hypothetical protein